MRVAFDATALLGARTGVGVFTEEVLAQLARHNDLHITAYGLSWRGRGQLQGAVPARVATVRRPMAARPLRTAWLRADHPVIERWTGPIEVVHGPNFVVPPTAKAAEVVTVHDLTAVRYPELCTADVLQYPALVRRALARGAWVHTVSEFVADEVVAEFKVERDRVVVVHNGAPPPPDDADRDAAARRGEAVAGGPRYILAVGTVEPRKNLPLLVRAFDDVADEQGELRLVIAGPDGWGAEELDAALAAARHTDRVVRLGWVANEQRADLLAGATVFAYPSRYEGFGLPPLEAMVNGVPVVATSAGALPEVLGDAAVLVAPDDQQALADALAAVLADRDGIATRLHAGGPAHAAGFSWDKTGAGLIDLYHRAAQGA